MMPSSLHMTSTTSPDASARRSRSDIAHGALTRAPNGACTQMRQSPISSRKRSTTIAVSDGISMGHEGMRASLVSREVIADSVETVMHAERFDALVSFAGCDKSLPGMMMASARLNVPSVFIYGGSILPGTFKGKPVTVQDVFEAVGKHSVGAMSDADLDELEHVACPSAGACGGQFTANTMACVSEAIGLALPGTATMPAVASARVGVARDLLRRHVERSPEDRAGSRLRRHALGALGQLGDAEVEQLHAPVRRDQHVGGLEVAVHDALVVRGGERVGDLDRALDGLARWKGARLQALAQRLALEQLGDGVGDAVRAAEVEDREDVRVRERGDGLRLALEARDEDEG